MNYRAEDQAKGIHNEPENQGSEPLVLTEQFEKQVQKRAGEYQVKF